VAITLNFGSTKQNPGVGTGFTYSRSMTAGTHALLEVTAAGAGAYGAPAVSDSSSTAWTIVEKRNAANTVIGFFAYRENLPSGITSVTVSSLASGAITYGFSEWNGVATSSSVDQNSGGTTGANPLSTGSITNVDANCLVVVIGGSDDSLTSAWSANAGWTTRWEEGDTNTTNAGKCLYQIASSNTGPFSATMDYPPATSNDVAIIMSFKPGAAAPAATAGPNPRQIYIMP
jgi:hypothetical protein